MNLNNCPCTLESGHKTYSPKALKKMFEGRKVAHLLSFNLDSVYANDKQEATRQRTALSISGAQVKYGLVLDGNTLRFPKENEQSTYILKPFLQDKAFKYASESPANEHLTMQIAQQVYKMRVAENALVFFDNYELAYLTKRFDIKADGNKIGQEDFATLLGYSRENAGEGFKAKGSYEAIAYKIKEVVASAQIELIRFFEQILFNYLFSNGDAHLKNFSLQQIDLFEYRLAPCYDLLNTRLHLPYDTALALDLFEKDYYTASYEAHGFYAYQDFYEFGTKIGIAPAKVAKTIAHFAQDFTGIQGLVAHSFLSEEAKIRYLQYYQDRRKALGVRFS